MHSSMAAITPRRRQARGREGVAAMHDAVPERREFADLRDRSGPFEHRRDRGEAGGMVRQGVVRIVVLGSAS